MVNSLPKYIKYECYISIDKKEYDNTNKVKYGWHHVCWDWHKQKSKLKRFIEVVKTRTKHRPIEFTNDYIIIPDIEFGIFKDPDWSIRLPCSEANLKLIQIILSK